MLLPLYNCYPSLFVIINLHHRSFSLFGWSYDAKSYHWYSRTPDNGTAAVCFPCPSLPIRKQYIHLQKLIKKTGKRVDREITSILKEFAEILIHGENVSDAYFESEAFAFDSYCIVSFWKKRCLEILLGSFCRNVPIPQKFKSSKPLVCWCKTFVMKSHYVYYFSLWVIYRFYSIE